MGFQIQYSCKKCGFKSPEDALIDPLGIPELYICSCKKCHSLFHRKKDKYKNIVNRCPNCGNTNIEIYENHHCIPCPQCDNEELNIECIGTFFRVQTMKQDIQANINIGDAIQYVIKSYKESECPVVKSGVDTLDTFTKGWYPGEFCIVGGRPGMGKTAFILSVMSNIAALKVPAVLFSATDSLNVYFMSRFISCIKSENDCLGIEKKVQMIENSNLHDVPLYFNMLPNLRLEYIKEQSEYLIKEKGVKIIFIETIQSIFNSEENGNTKEVMETICHKLKCMSTELNVPIIVTSDLNRSPEHREGIDGKIPQIADLRSCSAIENCADSIYLLYRPECYGIRVNDDKDLRGVMNIFIAKKKYNSKRGMLEVGFNHNNGRIYDFNNDILRDMQCPF